MSVTMLSNGWVGCLAQTVLGSEHVFAKNKKK